MRSLYALAHWYFTKQARPYWLVLVFDCLVVLFAAFFCFVLMHAGASTVKLGPWMLTWTVYLLAFLLFFRVFHTYTGVMRFSSFTDLYRIAAANAAALVFIAVLQWLLPLERFLVKIDWDVFVAIFFIATFFMVGARVVMKLLYDEVHKDRNAKRAFIYGVKSGGIALAKGIHMSVPSRFVLKGFVSDADDMVGHTLMDVEVFPNDEHLVEVMKEKDVKTLLVSPLKRDDLIKNKAMVDRLLEAGVTIFTYDQVKPWDGVSDIGQRELREVQIEDLLPREVIEVDLDAVKAMLHGTRVLITGSAGSIGTEIVRQVAAFGPAKMMLIDQAETPQHDIRIMMSRDFPEVEAEAVVTSISRRTRMEAVFSSFRPDYVFHAAAYKHVPMMEDNPSEAVMNNIYGTKVIADMSVKYGTKKFVMVSTDKAVNPTNVMGCSKRICEIYCQSLNKAIVDGQVEGVTQFVTTRFGNVLGSNGSVIPLFREQIKRGGPVTVTHPDIVRYFMLIPEACKLVLEAGTKGKGGEIFVFDMGKPVKIADLAKRMIALSGAKNIEIQYTGLRDGEKLYEEVLNDEENTKPTFHDKIRIASVREYDYAAVNEEIDALVDVAKEFDDMATVAKMKALVPEYKSQHSKYEVLDK